MKRIFLGTVCRNFGTVVRIKLKGRRRLWLCFSVGNLNRNCPQHITPRYTSEEIRELNAPLYEHIAKLEAEFVEKHTPDLENLPERETIPHSL
jgi:hypothetical protein